MMSRLSLLLFLALLLVSTFFALNSLGDLPEEVATHFSADGVADAWTKRDHYRLFILLLLVGLPLLLILLVAGLPRYTNGNGQIPNCEYWFAPERRHLTESFLISHACWLGCLTVAVVYGIHISILRANAITPPVLATNRLITMLVVYLCGLVWWTAAFLRHFKVRLENGSGLPPRKH
jgi:uncharacterized membrane protein